MPEIEIVVAKKEDIELRAEVRLDLLDLVGLLSQDQLFSLITGLDEQVGEWEFTNRLWAHFREARKEFLSEFPEEVGAEDSQ